MLDEIDDARVAYAKKCERYNEVYKVNTTDPNPRQIKFTVTTEIRDGLYVSYPVSCSAEELDLAFAWFTLFAIIFSISVIIFLIFMW